MDTLFNQDRIIETSIVTYRQWHTTRQVMLRNIATVVDFYNDAPFAVKGDHILIRLLQIINIPHNLSDHRFYDLVLSGTASYSNAAKLTSSVSQGRARDGMFLGPGNTEIYIGTDEGFDPVDANKNWKKLRPVEFMRHEKSDLAMCLPDGRASGTEAGIAVIKINIPMLAMQYRGFRREQQLLAAEGVPQRTIQHFIHQYVLPNSLYSYMDISLMNRLHYALIGRPFGIATRRNSIATLKYTNEVDLAHGRIIKVLKDRPMSMVGLMKNIPLLDKVALVRLIKVPDIAMTLQVSWAVSLAYFPIFDLLFRLAKYGACQANQMEVNQLLKLIKSFHSDGRLQSVLPKDVWYQTFLEMDDLQQLVGTI